MKKTMTGMFALATMILGMSATKGNATPVKAIDSIAVFNADSLAGADSLATFAVDSFATKGLDSLAGKTFISADSLAAMDTAAMRTHFSVRLDSLKGTDSLRAAEAGSITGKITPADGATEVEAVNAEGKIKAAVSQGTFTIPGAKAGNYVITVVGKQPYKSAVVKDVKVEDGKVTDIGEIKLEQ